MSKSGLVGAALIVGLVAYACGGPSDDTSDAASSSSSTAAPTSTAPVIPSPTYPSADTYALTPANAGSTYGVGPEVVTVTSVTDGDTFRVGDRRIRVIGIDSCEAGTTGGEAATAAARTALLGTAVTLTSEPGVDRDRYDREVRYVATWAGDFGRSMVPADHTAVYEGGNNASAGYLAGLRALDTGPSACGTPVAAQAPVRSQASEPRTAAPRTSAPTAAPRPLVRQEPKAAAAPAAPSGAYYKNCSAARAAGAAPLYRGQPGYAAKLDRDGDGVACE